MNNSSVLPNKLAKLTNNSLDSVNLSTDDISKIINNLDPNKAHGHDVLSIRKIELCGNSICKPLLIIFNDCLKESKSLSDWKKAHVVTVHKKGDKQCLKNYRPKLYKNFTDNNLISPLNRDLDLVTSVLTNYLLLLMKYTNRLTTDLE